MRNIFRRIRLFKNWYTLVFPLNRFGDKGHILCFRNGLRMFVSDIFSNEFAMVIEDWYGNDYGPLPKQGIIIDAGAHIGAFTLRAAYTTEAHVFAIEPIPTNFAILQKNIALNHLEKKVTARQIALGGKSGVQKIYLNSINSAGHGFEQVSGLAHVMKESIDVQVKTLSDFLASEHIAAAAFLKCDVEGAEYAIFFNTPADDFKKICSIALELHKREAYTLEDMRTFLEHKGYTTAWAKSPQMLHAKQEPTGTEKAQNAA